MKSCNEMKKLNVQFNEKKSGQLYCFIVQHGLFIKLKSVLCTVDA